MQDDSGKAEGVKDFRAEPESTAHGHVVQDVDGVSIVDSSPPESIAQMQRDVNGYDPQKFFDPENAVKNVEGVSRVSGQVMSADERFIKRHLEGQAEREELGREIDMADDD